MNKNLNVAKKAKNDEFYTQLSDIKKEIESYLEYNPDLFKDKTILCPCDNPEWSNFTVYFVDNFERLGLKKLISTGYNTSGKGKVLIFPGEIKELDGNGDFRSEEVKKLRDEADFIITNPPFSLFREFIAWLQESNKKFIVLGNKNAITYKEVFPLIKDAKMWLGTSSPADFTQPNDTHINMNGLCKWFTNVEHGRRHRPLSLLNFQDVQIFCLKGKFQKYDNYDAIEVPKTKWIPSDYTGIMGVPISFLDKYCPEQFEILGLGISNSGLEIGVKPYKPEHKKFRKEIQKRGAVDGDLYLIINNEVTVPYARILIRHKNPKQ